MSADSAISNADQQRHDGGGLRGSRAGNLQTTGWPPSVSVIMPVRQEGARFREVLSAVVAQDYPALDRIVIALAPSTDASRAIAQEVADAHEKVVIVENPCGIASTGLNAALRHVESDLVVRVDGHCLVPSGYVSRLVETLTEVGADCVGPRLNTVGIGDTQRGIASAMSSRLGVGGAQFRVSAESAFVDTVPFGIYRRDLLEKLGGFREELVRNQDNELNDRLGRAGGRIYLDAGLCVDYYPRRSLGQLWKQYFEYGYWRTVAVREFQERPRPRQLAPGLLVLVITGATGGAAAGRWRPLVGLTIAYGLVLGLLGGQTWRRTSSISVALCSVGAGMTMHLSYGLGLWLSLLQPRASGKPGSGPRHSWLSRSGGRSRRTAQGSRST